MRAPAAGRGDERGVMVILSALAMTVLLVVAALVLDVAQWRTDRRVNKSVADTAVRSGLAVLDAGPWPGVCRAREYLRANTRFSGFDAGSERWSRPGTPATTLTTSPCASPATAPFVTPCQPGQPGTWARLTATAGGGAYAIEIQSGYALPDARFPEDAAADGDTGDPSKGSCDNLAVVIRETRSPLFGGVVDRSDKTTIIRSVGRLSQAPAGNEAPALLLLEQHRCDVLTVNSSNSRVVAQPAGEQSGHIHLDTAADQGSCGSGQAALNGQATSGGPSILACSAKVIPTPGCRPSTVEEPSRIGIHALGLVHGPNVHVTSGPGTYGDTEAVRAPQVGRGPVDATYRQAVADLDADARAVLTGNGGRPPGCTSVAGGSCTSTDGTAWVVLQQSDCNSYGSFFTPARASAPRIWFGCDLNVSSVPLTLSAAGSFVVVTGSLTVRAPFSVAEPARLYVGGRSGGPGIGLDVGNGGDLNVGNATAGGTCAASPSPSPSSSSSRVVVGNGAFRVASGGAAHLCGAAVLLASGFGKVPAVDGTPPCACNGHSGTLSVGSGAILDWRAPNLVPDRRPTPTDLQTSPFEDLALWTEAGGSSSSVGSSATTAMVGVFFLGNADEFTLSGGSGLDVALSAQFVARRMKVTGGAVVNLVPNPFDAVVLPVRELVLVR